MEYFAYSQKEFIYKYVVMFTDIDLFRHMSYANYLKLIFLASDALLGPLLDKSFLNEARIKVVKTKMQFKHLTTLGERILIKVNASCIEPSSFDLLHTFVAEESGNLIGLGRQHFCLESIEEHEPLSLNNNFIETLNRILVDEGHLIYKY